MVGETHDTDSPLTKFYFLVNWGDVTNIPFQEVSGLDIAAQHKNYSHGNSPVFSEMNMPGIVKNGKVTMKKGVFANENSFWDWCNQIKINTIDPKNVVIKLMDENGNPSMTWTLTNAWPTKISAANLRPDGNKLAIESIEFEHEGLTFSKSLN